MCSTQQQWHRTEAVPSSSIALNPFIHFVVVVVAAVADRRRLLFCLLLALSQFRIRSMIGPTTTLPPTATALGGLYSVGREACQGLIQGW